MKFLTKSLRRQDGFTLVELMVVVAIIGLLSAVAIPNFKKYQAKAKMSEAKLQLSSIYTAETAFFGDYGMYAGCLAYMGYDPAPEIASRYYATGFGATVTIDPTTYDSATQSGLTTATCTNVQFDRFAAGKGVGAAIATTAFVPATAIIGTQAAAATQTFIAGAAGVIDGANTTAALSSALQLNELKTFFILRNGY